MTFKNNQIHQLPIKELENLRIEKLESQNSIFKYEEGLCEIEAGNLNSDFEIVINNNQNESIKIYAKKSKLIVDRGLTSFQDEINLPTIVTIDNVEIKSIRILIDRSAMEIFVNDGQYAMSVRFYLDKHNQIFTNINELEVYQLKGYSYQWNNIIFENKLKEI
nr:GH32 C-terminal domain-containing protein [Williamsoniiplasma somnilux]